MMWWAWTWLTGWWAFNPSRVVAPLHMCRRIKGERGWNQYFNFLRLWAPKRGFPFATVRLRCMLSQLVSASVMGQFGARCAPSTAHGLLWRMCRIWFASAATTTYLWATWSPVCRSLPNKIKRMLRIEQLVW